MSKALTYWNLMAYDYAGSWSTVSDDQANLYSGSASGVDTQDSINWYVSKGANLTPTSTPTTSPVTNSNTLPDPEKADSTVCPGVNTVPTQDHVKSGVGATIGRLEAPNNNMPATQKAEQGLQRAHGSSVSDEVGGAPASSYKREGRVRGLVHKVKDKLTHRGH